MRALLVGGGGREHALAWALTRHREIDTLFWGPGNGGTQAMTGVKTFSPPEDISSFAKWISLKNIDLVVVGPENPLVEGLGDALKGLGIPCFGPCADASRLEGSKAFAKEAFTRWGVPTAPFGIFSKMDEAQTFIEKAPWPVVVKADGLAAGKGVVVAKDIPEAVAAAHSMLVEDRFGTAGSSLVIEKRLDGQEVSWFGFVDGLDFVPLPTAKDHKRALDGDLGPNTGGMGAVSPNPELNDQVEEIIQKTVVKPLLKGLQDEGIPYQGCLFLGLMLTPDGPHLLEVNVRFGDPETQVLLPRLHSSLVDGMMAVANRNLQQWKPQWDSRPAVGVVLASGGYPGPYEKGLPITGISEAITLPDTFVFHAGTRWQGENWVTHGGRVLTVTALGDNVAEARRKAYLASDLIHFPHKQCRRDIADPNIRSTQ